jgi:cell division septation protein DedD
MSFTFGLFVGRQSAPVPFDVHQLEKHLLSLKSDVVREKEASLDRYFDETSDRTHLGFHDSLKNKEPDVPVDFDDPAPATPTPDAARDGIRVIRRSPSLKAKSGKTVTPVPLVSATAAPSAPPAPRRSPGGVTIQVAALSSAEDADRMVAALKSQGFDAYQTLTRSQDKGIRIRIRIGAFTDRKEAVGPIQALREKGYQPILVPR